MDPTFLVIILIGAAAMFLMSNRSRKQQKAAQSFRDNLQPGDEVMTHGGLFGTVVSVDGDVITLESPSGGRTDWLRAAISKIATPPWGPEQEDETPDDEAEYLDDDQYEDEYDETEDAVDDEPPTPASSSEVPATGDAPGDADRRG